MNDDDIVAEMMSDLNRIHIRILHEMFERDFWGGQNPTLQQVLDSPWPDRCRYNCYHRLQPKGA